MEGNKPKSLANGVALIIIPNIDPEQRGVKIAVAWNSICEAFNSRGYEDCRKIIKSAFEHTEWWENADEYAPGITTAISNWDKLGR